MKPGSGSAPRHEAGFGASAGARRWRGDDPTLRGGSGHGPFTRPSACRKAGQAPSARCPRWPAARNRRRCRRSAAPRGPPARAVGREGAPKIPGRDAPAAEADFLRMKERAETMLERGPEDRTGRTLQAFAEGGLAYLAGNDAAAATALAEAQQLGRDSSTPGRGRLY